MSRSRTPVTPMRVVGYVGRFLLAAGVLVLAFVGYQLWGTGLHEARAQDELDQQFQAELASETVPPSDVDPDDTLPAKPVASAQLATETGQPIGRLKIPKLHLNKVFVQGITLEQLNRAPGHYPQTPFPGQAGNASIAGHRSTYGAPFYNIDKLKPGDEIHLETLQGDFTYKVQWAKITQPDAMWVLDTAKDHPNTLTLTACHPRMDLTQRYIIRAVLQGEPVPRLPGQDAAMQDFAENSDSLADGVTAASHPGAWKATLVFGLICAAVWLATWWASRRWRRADRSAPPRWLRTVLPYVVGVPVFAGVLFVFFENLSKMLPAGI